MKRDFPEDLALEILSEAHLIPLVPWDSLTEASGRNNPVGQPWLCACLKCLNIVSPRLRDIRRDSGGCPDCRDRKPGHNGITNLTSLARDVEFAAKPTIVYLVRNEHGWKVGIGSPTRAKAHGGAVALVTKPLPRLLAFEIEQRLLDIYSHWRIRVDGVTGGGATEYLSDNCPVDVDLITSLVETVDVDQAFADAWADASYRLFTRESA